MPAPLLWRTPIICFLCIFGSKGYGYWTSRSRYGRGVQQYSGSPPSTASSLAKSQARKKSTKINFLGPETARWGGGLPLEGVVAENFVPALESLSSLGFEERNLGCFGNFAGMSRTPGGVQKVCAKKVRVHFSFPTQQYHPLQNHYTHEIIIFELFRGLQLQFSGVFRINSYYSYSFLVLYAKCDYRK